MISLLKEASACIPHWKTRCNLLPTFITNENKTRICRFHFRNGTRISVSARSRQEWRLWTRAMRNTRSAHSSRKRFRTAGWSRISRCFGLFTTPYKTSRRASSGPAGKRSSVSLLPKRWTCDNRTNEPHQQQIFHYQRQLFHDKRHRIKNPSILLYCSFCSSHCIVMPLPPCRCRRATRHRSIPIPRRHTLSL